MRILQLMSLFIWLFVIPFGIGLLPARWFGRKMRSPGRVFLAGFVVMLGIFELIALPVVLFVVYHGMTVLLWLFVPATVVLAAAGFAGEVIAWRKRGGRFFAEWNMISFKEAGIEEKIGWLLFLLAVGFQLYMAYTRASFDGDDAYYVVQSLTAQQQDRLYRLEPYTGASTLPDLRHALATFPLWPAALAVISGMHATALSHSILPLVLLPLSYLLFFHIGKSLLPQKREMRPMFMIIMALLQIFGNVSIYTSETFLLTRTWQGKSFSANFVIPAILWLFLWIFTAGQKAREGSGSGADAQRNVTDAQRNAADSWTEKNIADTLRPEKTMVLWLLLGAVNWIAGLGSSLAVFLCVMLTALFGLFTALWQKNFRILLNTAMACLPGVAYILIYLILTH